MEQFQVFSPTTLGKPLGQYSQIGPSSSPVRSELALIAASLAREGVRTGRRQHVQLHSKRKAWYGST